MLIVIVAMVSAVETGKLFAGEGGYSPEAGPFRVDVAELTLEDAGRHKEISLKVRFPVSDRVFPVIVFSHGYRYDKDVFGPLSEFWVRHGYVVIHPTHSDARALTNKTGQTVRMADPAVWKERTGDIAFVIGSLEEVRKKMTGFAGGLDHQRIGVGGHSFGAYTSMLIGGATVLIPGEDEAAGFADARVHAILPIAGQGRGQQGLYDRSWDKIDLPMMMITGMNDKGLNGEAPDWRAEGFRFSPSGDKYWAFVREASHFSYDGRTGGKTSDRIAAVVKTVSIAFWDAYLRGSSPAKDYLVTGKAEDEFGEWLEFSAK